MSYRGPLLDGGPWTISQGFGCTDFTAEWRNCRGCAYFHAGIDIAANAGTGVHALAAGAVIGVGSPCAGPNAVGVRCGGNDFWYFHLQSHMVQLGDWVGPGALLGQVGTMGCSTGPHLHYQVQPAGVAPDCVHALDPGPFLQSWPCGAPPPPPVTCPPGWQNDGGICTLLPPLPPPPQPIETCPPGYELTMGGCVPTGTIPTPAGIDLTPILLVLGGASLVAWSWRRGPQNPLRRTLTRGAGATERFAAEHGHPLQPLSVGWR